LGPLPSSELLEESEESLEESESESEPLLESEPLSESVLLFLDSSSSSSLAAQNLDACIRQ
jgi:hypothetical protein